MPQLPSVEECQTFLATINKGREAIGLDTLEALDFDKAQPDSLSNCLSARNLFAEAGYRVGMDYVEPDRADCDPLALTALGMDLKRRSVIPEAILAVTRYFDACGTGHEGAELPTLRERMVEAGVVAC